MTRRVMILLLSACLMAATAQAGLFKNSVDLADLAEVSAEELEALRETEFAVFVAQVRLNAAKAAERRASGAVKAVDRTLDAENLDLKAAKAELKAAKANQDDERTTAAKAQLSGAEEDLKTARALRAWKTQEEETRQAEVKQAKSALDLAEARRDAARARLLRDASAASASKYDLEDLERSVSKRQADFDKASGKVRAEASKLEQRRLEWDKLAKGVGITEAEQN